MSTPLQAKAEAVIYSNSRSAEINLEGLGLESFDDILPALSQCSNLRTLKLARNKITSLPENMTALAGLQHLDLAGNPIAGLNSVIRGLFCLTNLKHLYIDLPYESDEDEIIVSLHSLESFNGTPLLENDDENLDIPPASHIGGSATRPSVHQDPAPGSRHNEGLMNSNNNRADMGGSGSGQGIKKFGSEVNKEPLGAKTRWDDNDMEQIHRLYSAANSVSNRVVNKAEFDEYTRNVVKHLHTLLNGENDPFKREGEILKAKKIMFEYCFEEVARSSQRFDANLSQVLKVVQETYGALLDNYDRLSKNLVEDRERKLQVIKGDMQEAARDIEQLMAMMEKDGGNARCEQEKKALKEEVAWLKAENDKLRAQLRQTDVSRLENTAKSASAVVENKFQPMKVLTQRQLRDVIEDIYASKSKYDIKCAETHLPRETMEQHMYTYLNQRYGLKHLILEWATAIIQGVKKYSSEDNDVAVFGKILRNEVDEEFRFVQRQLKETVHELLRVYLKGKYPLKGDEDITGMLKKRITGNVAEEEWIDIVKYMYNAEDSVSIVMRINDTIQQQAGPRRRTVTRGQHTISRTTKRGPDADSKAVSYQQLLRILLDFQLEGHERFLSKFVRIFKQHDSDRNGIVNEYEFRMILSTVDPSKTEEEVNALLELIDPHNNQLINFSECVTFLSSELVRMMRDETS